ncbi:MAG: hypothetical protein M1818_007899 [Claussenomyces sp. TS43310]|nr:MAG: hypothetical protein M1818_007899 [Claussenomyces sp. TS43310]
MAQIYNSQLDAYSLYHQQREKETSTPTAALPALGHAFAGSTGTAISNLCLYPLDLIITRLQVQRTLRNSSTTPVEGEYQGVFDAASQIYNRGGILAFYTGVVQDTGKSIADSFLFFLFYDYMRQNRLQKNVTKATSLPVLDELAVGALAGACSKFFTTPISNIVTRKQMASMISARSSSRTAPEPSVRDIIEQIRSEKGLQGFWSGYSASLVLTLNPSLTFFMYESFKRTLLPRSRRDDPGAKLTFLMAAVSKAIASTVTYPFSLAKARAQAGTKPPVNRETASDVKAEAEAAVHAENATEAKKVGKEVKRTAARSTVFSTILEIYREHGLAALYEGVSGEILKGFFSHGITMIVKEAAHKFIIQLYFIILKLLKRTPSSAEVMDQAKGAAGQAGTSLSTAYDQAGDAASDAYGKAKATAENVAQNVTETAENALEGVKSGLADANERAQVLGSNATELAKNGGEYAGAKAGTSIGVAREKLGGNVESAGMHIKGGSGEGSD